VIEAGKAPASAANVTTSILMPWAGKLEKADLRKVVLRRQITPQQAQRRVKADGFRINGDIYVKPDRLRRWVPSPRDRVALKDTGVVRTRRDDAAIEVISWKPQVLRPGQSEVGSVVAKRAVAHLSTCR
jgi:hypothetical protein